jgi:repressor LexA
MRIIARMPFETLLNRIDERLAALKLSERKACLMAGLKVDAIRDIRRRGYAPKPQTMASLAKVLQVPTAYLVEAAVADSNTSPAQLALSRPLETIFVKGFVQAGSWREAIEWGPQDWYAYSVPSDPRFPGVERFGLEVRGPSMDMVYPDGSIIIVARYADMATAPQPGDRVVSLRRSATGDYEATVKELVRDERGRWWLWPRSNDPEHQQPIPLPAAPETATSGTRLPTSASAGPLPADAGEPDVKILAKVLWSLKME